MRIAYIIIAHRNPEQLARLVSRLGAASPIFIHFDRRAKGETFRRVVDLLSVQPNVRFVKRYPCYWGCFNVVKGTLRAIRDLVESGSDYDYAMLLSGQDYPIKPPEQIHNFLEGHRGAEFIESFALASPNRWSDDAQGVFQAMDRVQYWHLRFRSRHLCVRVRRTFPPGFSPYGGSQWWCLTRGCIEHIDATTRGNRKLADYFKYVNMPEESYFQTVVSNSPFAGRIVQDDLKFAIWDRPDPPRPADLGVGDLEALTRSSMLFARKFNPAFDPAIFDVIDRELLGIAATGEGPSPVPLGGGGG